MISTPRMLGGISTIRLGSVELTIHVLTPGIPCCPGVPDRPGFPLGPVSPEEIVCDLLYSSSIVSIQIP